jgi:hypothetical protein
MPAQPILVFLVCFFDATEELGELEDDAWGDGDCLPVDGARPDIAVADRFGCRHLQQVTFQALQLDHALAN